MGNSSCSCHEALSFSYSGLLPASQLWVLDERRSLFRRAPTEPVQLTSGPIRWNTPIPGKDGTKIFAHGVILRGELVRYDAQSSRLQPWLGGISAEFVTFSPDGQFVAYVTFPEGILWRANRDGSNPVQLTDAPLYPLNLRWSPDGSQILFCSHAPEGRVRAYVTFSQGGTPRPVLPEDKEGQSDPSWSPDGHKIVFSTLETIGAFNSVLRVLDLVSHQVTTLSDRKACGRLDGPPMAASSPVCTPALQEASKSSTLRRSDGR
jgi:WD40 repeat protein